MPRFALAPCYHKICNLFDNLRRVNCFRISYQKKQFSDFLSSLLFLHHDPNYCNCWEKEKKSIPFSAFLRPCGWCNAYNAAHVLFAISDNVDWNKNRVEQTRHTPDRRVMKDHPLFNDKFHCNIIFAPIFIMTLMYYNT